MHIQYAGAGGSAASSSSVSPARRAAAAPLSSSAGHAGGTPRRPLLLGSASPAGRTARPARVVVGPAPRGRSPGGAAGARSPYSSPGGGVRGGGGGGGGWTELPGGEDEGGGGLAGALPPARVLALMAVLAAAAASESVSQKLVAANLYNYRWLVVPLSALANAVVSLPLAVMARRRAGPGDEAEDLGASRYALYGLLGSCHGMLLAIGLGAAPGLVGALLAALVGPAAAAAAAALPEPRLEGEYHASEELGVPPPPPPPPPASAFDDPGAPAAVRARTWRRAGRAVFVAAAVAVAVDAAATYPGGDRCDSDRGDVSGHLAAVGMLFVALSAVPGAAGDALMRRKLSTRNAEPHMTNLVVSVFQLLFSLALGALWVHLQFVGGDAGDRTGSSVDSVADSVAHGLACLGGGDTGAHDACSGRSAEIWTEIGVLVAAAAVQHLAFSALWRGGGEAAHAGVSTAGGVAVSAVFFSLPPAGDLRAPFEKCAGSVFRPLWLLGALVAAAGLGASHCYQEPEPEETDLWRFLEEDEWPRGGHGDAQQQRQQQQQQQQQQQR